MDKNEPAYEKRNPECSYYDVYTGQCVPHDRLGVTACDFKGECTDECLRYLSARSREV